MPLLWRMRQSVLALRPERWALENPGSLIKPGTRGRVTSDRAAATPPVTPARPETPSRAPKKYGLIKALDELGLALYVARRLVRLVHDG